MSGELRERLIEALNTPTHAPMDTHNKIDGSCTECPWPLYALPPEDIADGLLPFMETERERLVNEIADWIANTPAHDVRVVTFRERFLP